MENENGEVLNHFRNGQAFSFAEEYIFNLFTILLLNGLKNQISNLKSDFKS